MKKQHSAPEPRNIIPMYIDAYAIIVQKDMDGGDSLHREGMYAFALKLREKNADPQQTHEGREADNGLDQEREASKNLRAPSLSSTDNGQRGPSPKRNLASVEESPAILQKFEVGPGIYVRHPDPTKWYSNPETTSRDQLFPVIAYCAAYEDYPRLWRLFKATAKRGFFAQNWLRIGEGEHQKKLPDPMFMNIAHFIRAGGWWTAPLYPTLFFFDALELIGTVFSALPLHFRDDHLIPRFKNQNDVDDNNLVVQHLLAANYKPTPFSALARYIYATTRPRNFGNTKLGERNAVMGALRWYHRSEFGGHGNPEIAEAFRPLIEEYFDAPSPLEWLKRFWSSDRVASN